MFITTCHYRKAMMQKKLHQRHFVSYYLSLFSEWKVRNAVILRELDVYALD